MDNMTELLQKWQLDLGKVRNNVYRSATPRERERWHALWLVARGWTAAQVAEALERDPHTIGEWLEAFRQAGPEGLVFEQGGGSPPPWARRSRHS
jgi:transposase